MCFGLVNLFALRWSAIWLNMTFSITFDVEGRILIGRKDAQLFGDVSGFWIGIILLVFNVDGKVLVTIDRFIML